MTNVQKLEIERISQTMSEGKDFDQTVQALVEGKELPLHARAAKRWVEDAIGAVRTTRAGKLLDDEEIAGAILEAGQKRKDSILGLEVPDS